MPRSALRPCGSEVAGQQYLPARDVFSVLDGWQWTLTRWRSRQRWTVQPTIRPAGWPSCSTPTISASSGWRGGSRADPDDPADLVQETFLRVARAPHACRTASASEEAWLVRVLINVCRDNWRHAAVRVRAAAAGHVRAAAPSIRSRRCSPTAMVWQALDLLPPRRRAILVLSSSKARRSRQIARLLGVTPVTVRWHLMRARREMARVLGDER